MKRKKNCLCSRLFALKTAFFKEVSEKERKISFSSVVDKAKTGNYLK
jgi:hypothetical protein